MIDARSETNIATLHSKVQCLARSLLSKLHIQKIDARIISGTRTFAEQDALYALGRSKPGNIVTHAKGGYSWHNFGIAFDIGIFENGKYLEESPLYDIAGQLGKNVGLEWGGDWKSFPDKPHFQYKTGLTLAEIRKRFLSREELV